MREIAGAQRHELRCREASSATLTDRKAVATTDIGGAMNSIFADAFALCLKSKDYHWHMNGPHFRDYCLSLYKQAD